MILLDCRHNSPEWRQVRAGIPTASRFDSILTPVKLQPSKASDAYLHHLIAEWLLGHAIEEGSGSMWTERGLELEGEAVAYYEFERSRDTTEAGFVLRDDRRVGCSPDRLVGEDGGLEIKCPSAATHVGYLLDSSSLVAEYRGQVQGSLYVTGRAWWDLLSYCPGLPSVLVRVEPDAAYAKAVDPALADFLARMDAAKAQVESIREVECAENPLA